MTGALQMTQDDVATFPARLFLKVASEFLANPA
jgi:hypothetical protein